MSVRRRIVLLIVCIALGAIVNVAVAWGCCLWWQPEWAGENLDVSTNQIAAAWRKYAQVGWPDGPTDAHFQATGGAERFSLAGYTTFSGSTYAMVVFRSGWPLRTLEGALLHEGWSNRNRRNVVQIHFDVPGTGVKNLPRGLLIPGFVANSLFYAAVVWMLIRGPAEARRRWREYKGRCGMCGYPRGTSTVCTECGADLSRAWGSQGVANDPAKRASHGAGDPQSTIVNRQT